MLYIDDTYISSLDELKEIVVSHTKDGKVDDDFRTELIESFEDSTDTGLLFFIDSQQTDDAKKYADQLKHLEDKWESLSASEQYNALVSFFNIVSNKVDIMKYIEITNVDIIEEEGTANVSIDIKIIVPANEYLQFEIKLYDENDKLLHSLTTQRLYLAAPTNTLLHLNEQVPIYETTDKVEVCLNHKLIAEQRIGNILSFSINGVEFRMIFVKGGKFMMGSAVIDAGSVHEVELSNFYIAETPVTQALWTAVMGNYPSEYEGADYPVENVSWNDCSVFIGKLNNMLANKIAGRRFDFPTEAQWEYAAKGGNAHEPDIYSGGRKLRSVAWYYGNSNYRTHSVKRKIPNALGIYDMSGNVWEWCKDKFDRNFYSTDEAAKKDPICKDVSSTRYVVRGGSYRSEPYLCSITYRDHWQFDFKSNEVGLRLVLCQD